MRFAHVASVLSCLSILTTAKLAPTGDGCADPTGIATCVADIDSQFLAMGSQCNETEARTGGQTTQADCLHQLSLWQDAAYIGCYIQSCWNKVYGCDYQRLVIQYYEDAEVGGPFSGAFFPPPAGAPGACSCSLVEAYANLTEIFVEGLPCIDYIGGDDTTLSYCDCCSKVRQYSAAINTCPDSDLSIIGLSQYMSDTTNLSPWNKGFDCSPALNSQQCTPNFGFVLGAGTEFYDPISPPVGVPGTKPLSDVGTLTTFPAAQTFPLTIARAGYTSTITMVPSNAKNVATATAARGSGQANGASASATGSGSGPGSTSGSGSGSSSTSAGFRQSVRPAIIVLLAGAVTVALF